MSSSDYEGLTPSSDSSVVLRPLEIVAPRIDTYRFSMANLEETQDADLDAILGELCALDSEYDEELCRVSADYSALPKKNITNENYSHRQGCHSKDLTDASIITRTDSPDNDSAFSDTVSMLSSESSASSSASAKCKALKLNLQQDHKDGNFQQKADKIKLALERMREANVKKLFIKAFSTDGSSKSLLVDEKMTCGYVTRLLADKNHVSMEPKWAIVEQIPDLHMERVYEDHELFVENLMLWTRESKNKILFAERPEKIALFQRPEKFLLTEDDRGWSSEHDEHSRQVIIDEFFSSTITSTIPPISGHRVPQMEGNLYLKHDSRKGWKQYFFVLRPSGLYYSPKDKVKTLKELVCLSSFETNEIYIGVNWKKKYKSPTDHCFAIKHPRLQQPKSVKFIKFLCADDERTLERWITAIRIAKHGKQLLENHRTLVEELTQEDLDHLAHARSCSISSISTKLNGGVAPMLNSPAQSTSSNVSVANSDVSSGRHSRASSSSSSGCMSDGGTASESAFDCEFPMGTIKRKPSMKPNIPLTWMTRQLKEMAEKEHEVDEQECGVSAEGGTLTRRTRRTEHNDSTLKRHTIDTSKVYGSTSSNNSASNIGSSANTAPKVESTSPTYGHYEIIDRENGFRNSSESGSQLYGYSSIYERVVLKEAPDSSIEDLPPPPPPLEDIPDNMSTSMLSLESLPPPPPLQEDMCGSLLSLPPPPPELAVDTSRSVPEQLEQTVNTPQVTPPPVFRQKSLDNSSVSSGSSRVSSHPSESIYGTQIPAYGACLQELNTKRISNGSGSLLKSVPSNITKELTGSIKKVIFADDIVATADKKTLKKISFAQSTPVGSPRKPPPPKRNESTRLSVPKKLTESSNNPPNEFLKDLQRVMRKKWQVAQKCKLEPATTPHEVLGFREFNLSEDYKETSVSMWVQEHYGAGYVGGDDPFYENVVDRGTNNIAPKRDPPRPFNKRPPPAPPRRADTTHLTTTTA